MELHPILESGDKPTSRLWFVISCPGGPSPRVGHACTVSNDGLCLYVIGGADPSTVYRDVYRLDLLKQVWTKLSLDGVNARYEHCAITEQGRVYIFGGANKSNNLNDVQLLEEESRCLQVECTGTPPSPRTIHCAASDEEHLYVWGGGHTGPDPVSDAQLHIFNSTSHSWTQPTLKGETPSVRHGHVMALVDKQLFIHGGMSGATFHKDLHCLLLNDYSCVKIKSISGAPCARAAHASCVFNKSILISGGMSSTGALDDMHCYDTVTSVWTQLKFDGPSPTPRLDHTMVIMGLRYLQDDGIGSSKQVVTSVSSQPHIIPVDSWGRGGDYAHVNGQMTNHDAGNIERSLASSGNASSVPVCIIFGGMDTSGNVFDDLLILRLDDLL